MFEFVLWSFAIALTPLGMEIVWRVISNVGSFFHVPGSRPREPWFHTSEISISHDERLRGRLARLPPVPRVVRCSEMATVGVGPTVPSPGRSAPLRHGRLVHRGLARYR